MKKKIIIIGNGISGLTCALYSAMFDNEVFLVSKCNPELSQSVMAAGGINAVTTNKEEGDDVSLHIQETYNGGCEIAGLEAIKLMCEDASDLINLFDRLGVCFNKDKDDKLSKRAFGGQKKKRTHFAGTLTGKQIVSGLSQGLREYIANGQVKTMYDSYFINALMHEGICKGVLIYDQKENTFKELYCDKVVIATGGLNGLFNKTTGSTLSDAYTTAKLFTQGVELKNLEFIQYHPTSIETPIKRLLISEAARGEGGRLFYLDENKKRIYFMEDMYGERGNLMPRDIVSKHINELNKQVYLDISFLDKKVIHERLEEIAVLCKDYLNLDVTKTPIPISPTIHFFMGGIAVDKYHHTNIKNLFAIGEAASIYHGANRLGGNSLLAAAHSGKIVAQTINEEKVFPLEHDFSVETANFKLLIQELKNNNGSNTYSKINNKLRGIMSTHLGIVRNGEDLNVALKELEELKKELSDFKYDDSALIYRELTLEPLFDLAKAILLSALERKESRGSHLRSDYPNSNDTYKKCSYINKNFEIKYLNEDDYAC